MLSSLLLRSGQERRKRKERKKKTVHCSSFSITRVHTRSEKFVPLVRRSRYKSRMYIRRIYITRNGSRFLEILQSMLNRFYRIKRRIHYDLRSFFNAIPVKEVDLVHCQFHRRTFGPIKRDSKPFLSSTGCRVILHSLFCFAHSRGSSRSVPSFSLGVLVFFPFIKYINKYRV